MTPSTSIQPYDFRKPRRLADDVEHELVTWASSLATLITDRWEQQLGIEVQWSAKQPVASTRGQLVKKVSEGYTCFGFRLGDEAMSIWAAMPRRMAIGLMVSTLGEELTEFPEDRRLTDVELSVMDLAWDEFARVATDAQPYAPPLVCEPDGPRRSQELVRAFSEQEPITVLEFELETPYGSENLLWLLSQEATLHYLSHASECRQRIAGDSPSLESTLNQVSMEMIVRLGGAKLHVSDLLNLQPGDVIVLDQRVSEPLSVEVSKSVMFRGWPGRIGSRQALQISDVVEEAERAERP